MKISITVDVPNERFKYEPHTVTTESPNTGTSAEELVEALFWAACACGIHQESIAAWFQEVGQTQLDVYDSEGDTSR